MPEFYHSSQQTRVTPLVKAFAKNVFPFDIEDEQDLQEVVFGIRQHLSFPEELRGKRSVNPLVDKALTSFVGKSSKLSKVEVRRLHSLLAGDRTAHQVIKDKFASPKYGCTDLNTVVMAVLRAKGVPCRLRRTFNPETHSQSCYTEVQLGDMIYRIAPMKEEAQRQVMPNFYDSKHVHVFSKDHASSGLNLFTLINSPRKGLAQMRKISSQQEMRRK